MPLDTEIDILVTVLCWCALVVQVGVLRGIIADGQEGGAIDVLRCAGWFMFAVRFAQLLHDTGGLPLAPLSQAALIMLAVAEISAAITRKSPL